LTQLIHPYRKTSLEQMFGLQDGDIDILIDAEAVPFYSAAHEEFIGYIPSIDSYFPLDAEAKKACQRNIKDRNYNVDMTDSLIRISSKVKAVSASSFLYNNRWLEPALDLLEIGDNFSLLISNRPEVPVFCGHERFVKRLAENFSGDIYVMNAVEFIKKWRTV
jgi:hypothetical protein